MLPGQVSICHNYHKPANPDHLTAMQQFQHCPWALPFKLSPFSSMYNFTGIDSEILLHLPLETL